MAAATAERSLGAELKNTFPAQSTHLVVTVMFSGGNTSTPILRMKQLRLRKEPVPSCTTELSSATEFYFLQQRPSGDLPSPPERSPLPREMRAHPLRAPHLQDFALGTLRKQQHLVIQRVQRFASDFGLLLGNADAVLQQVGLDVGR